jgi:ABC-type phosphate transport system permease subunit
MHELVAGAATVVIGFVGAIVLLPAVHRLRPKA